MPKWKIHDKWARKLGISQEVSKYVNNIIDSIREGKNLPQEYLDFVKIESTRIAEQSKKRKGVIRFAIEQATIKHDSGGRKRTSARIASEIQLQFLSNKGNDFVKAWYLHHVLDYLKHETICEPNEDLKIFLSKFQKNRPVEFPFEILNLIENNIQELKNDLH